MRVGLVEDGLRATVGDRGSSPKSFNAALGREFLEGAAAFPDQATARGGLFRWVNRYNTRRRHSSLGQISSNTYGSVYAVATSATLQEAG